MTSPAVSLLSAWPGDPFGAIRQMWALPFMLNAFRAGTLTALLAGVTGWFMVARRQTFAGHTLSVVGFPGAAGAVLVGAPVWAGYLGFTTATALVLAGSGGSVSQAVDRSGGAGRGQAEGALIGTAQAFALACGFLFVARYAGLLGGATSLLFGSFLGITAGQVSFLAVVTGLELVALTVLGRRLLFATVDPVVAQARGVPAAGTNLWFLLLLAVAVAATVQVTGALLVFTVLVLPAATAQRLSARPAVAIVVAVLIAMAVVWVGLTVAFYTRYPFGFWLSTLAFAGYVLAVAGGWLRDRWLRGGRLGHERPGAVG
jgi:zinc/manganese transport system permease protein